MEIYSEKRVRLELPNVEVSFRQNGKPVRITCIVSGRLNEFATVRPFEIGSAVSWEFSWSAIAHSLNTGKPLLVEMIGCKCDHCIGLVVNHGE